jgi:hypothetical protein
MNRRTFSKLTVTGVMGMNAPAIAVTSALQGTRVLSGPYRFEVETHPAVEMTLYHQPENRRLLAGLAWISTGDHSPKLWAG